MLVPAVLATVVDAVVQDVVIDVAVVAAAIKGAIHSVQVCQMIRLLIRNFFLVWEFFFFILSFLLFFSRAATFGRTRSSRLTIELES